MKRWSVGVDPAARRPRGQRTNAFLRKTCDQISHCHSGLSKLPCVATTMGRGVVAPSGIAIADGSKPSTTSGWISSPDTSGGAGGAVEALGAALSIAAAGALGLGVAAAASLGAAALGARTPPHAPAAIEVSAIVAATAERRSVTPDSYHQLPFAAVSSRAAEQNRATITKFYECFQKRDADGMVACYADDVRFTDPVFETLEGKKAGGMWKMLLSGGGDLQLEFKDVQADERRGSAHWDAHYTFKGTGRFVHNSIDAAFVFRDGLIVEHVDTFDLKKWAGQALGPAGKIFGGFGFLQRKIRKMAQGRLEDYLAKSR